MTLERTRNDLSNLLALVKRQLSGVEGNAGNVEDFPGVKTDCEELSAIELILAHDLAYSWAPLEFYDSEATANVILSASFEKNRARFVAFLKTSTEMEILRAKELLARVRTELFMFE